MKTTKFDKKGAAEILQHPFIHVIHECSHNEVFIILRAGFYGIKQIFSYLPNTEKLT